MDGSSGMQSVSCARIGALELGAKFAIVLLWGLGLTRPSQCDSDFLTFDVFQRLIEGLWHTEFMNLVQQRHDIFWFCLFM
jgi:hypothetical protein